MNTGSLIDNVRVIEVGAGWVGPWAALMLADLGAEVIKVESIRVPDFNRTTESSLPAKSGNSIFYANFPNGSLGEKQWNRNSYLNASCFGKCDVTLDLLHPVGNKLFMKLVEKSDVFVSNLAVGVDEKLGITYEALAKVNPQIIYATSAGYGRTGPYADRVAMGNTIDAASGIAALRDYGDGDSTSLTPDVHCDIIAALSIAFSVVAALYRKQKTGKGMYIDAAMVEPSMLHIGEAIMDYTMNQRIQRSTGNRDASMSPQGCYPCQGEDEWVTLSIASDEEWQRFVKVTGNPQLANDERFSTILGRLNNQDELDKSIASWTGSYTKFEVMDMLQQASIAAGAVCNNKDVYDNEHLKQRNHWDVVDEPDAGRHTYPGKPWKLLNTKEPKREPAPLFGEHNNYVLKDILGLSAEDVAKLEKEGYIGTTPL